jgi:hypothetical protein
MERVSGDAFDTTHATPARLTAYDAPLDLESITPQMRENLDDELTEVKSENAIDRVTCQANARTLERVPAGARFRVRFVLDVLCAEDRELLAKMLEGLRLLEDDSLGGGGSRGNGRVRFENWKLTWRGRGFYAAGEAESVLMEGAASTADLQAASSAAAAGEIGLNAAGNMKPALLIRLRPTTPWRIGPGDRGAQPGGRRSAQRHLVFRRHQAMAQFQLLEEWLSATARPSPSRRSEVELAVSLPARDVVRATARGHLASAACGTGALEGRETGSARRHRHPAARRDP